MKILLLSLMILSCTTALAQHPDDYRWDDRFSTAGISNPYLGGNNAKVNTLAATPDYVVAGGEFTIPGMNIALWNKKTNTWEKAGKGVWKTPTQYDNPFVRGLYAEGDSVFVWGNFTSVDGNIPATNFAILNPRTKVWSADTMLKGGVDYITRFGADIIINGIFSIKGTNIRNIARWNNGKWSEFSADTTVIAGHMAVFKGDLYSYVRYVTLNNYVTLAKWSGAAWIPVIDSITPKIQLYSIPITGMKATADYLYIYGAVDSLRPVGGSYIKANSLARFDGTTWVSMLETSLQSHIQSMALDGDDIFISGDFTSVNGINADGIARWNHTTKQWSSLGSGIPYYKYGWSMDALTITDKQVFIAGEFAVAGGQYANNIARYDQSAFRWYPLGDDKTMAPILTDFASILSVFADNNKLLAIGGFVYANDKILNNIGYWNGTSWENIGTGIVGGATLRDDVVHIISGPTGLTQFTRKGDTMYLGGSFEQLGSYQCDNITTYINGVTECVGGGIQQSHLGSNGQFTAPPYLTGMQTIGNKIYVAGDFKRAGNTLSVESIAEWDGKKWSDMGGGILNSRGSFLLAVDSMHNLLVGGKFNNISGVACNGLASWDGQQWQEVTISPKDSQATVSAVCIAPNGDVYLAGTISVNGNPASSVILRKRGDILEKIADVSAIPPSYPVVTAMACKGDKMYIGGNFNRVGDCKAEKVALWNFNAEQWSALGSGFKGTTYNDTLTNTSDKILSIAFVGDTVYFGGTFSYVAAKPSFNIAAWLPPKTNSVGDGGGTQTILRCAPNPAATQVKFTMQLVQNGNLTLAIHDALGRVVIAVSDEYRTAGEYSMTASTIALPTGVYYARLVSGGTVVTIPVSVIH